MVFWILTTNVKCLLVSLSFSMVVKLDVIKKLVTIEVGDKESSRPPPFGRRVCGLWRAGVLPGQPGPSGTTAAHRPSPTGQRAVCCGEAGNRSSSRVAWWRQTKDAWILIGDVACTYVRGEEVLGRSKPCTQGQTTVSWSSGVEY